MTGSPYFLKGHITFLCMSLPCFLYPSLGYCEQVCNGYWGTNISWDTDFISWIYISSINRLYDSSIFEFLRNLMDVGGRVRVHLWLPRLPATAWMSAWTTTWAWASSGWPFFFKKVFKIWGIFILFPAVAGVFYNYTNNSQGLQFFHIFVNIYYLWFIC